MRLFFVVELAFLLLIGGVSTSKALPGAVSDLAPTGKLRAAINLGNAVLASRDANSGEPVGVSVDMARELARRLGVPLELIPFDAAGKVVEAGKAGAWDIAFVALDPLRAADMAQSTPYVVIEGAYLVGAKSQLRSNDEVDRAGNRVLVVKGSAYDLFLSRSLKQASIVRVSTSGEAVDYFMKENLEVEAGVKQQLEQDARRVSGGRLLPGHFMVINQAVASQLGKEAGARYVREFVEEMKASGFIARSLKQHQIEGAAVAPPGDVKP